MPPSSYLPLSLLTATTALVASILGPFVTLTVARHQFRANVLSTNRQKWIDGFRDRLAELLSVMSAAQVIKRASADAWRGGEEIFRDNPALAEKLEKTYQAVAQIRLLTKAGEPSHQALNDAIATALARLSQDELWEAEHAAHIAEITDLGRGIIRQEWSRVKRGV
jgi:hypothetical protein